MRVGQLGTWSPVEGMRSAWLLNVDSERYPFQRYFRDEVFRVEALENLHLSHLCSGKSQLDYQDNLELRRRMQRLPLTSSFYQIYERFVREQVAACFGGRISYAARPKMRVHLAGTGSVSRWHRDAEVTGRLEQINIWLPVTPCFGGNSLWVENDYGSGSYQAIAVRLGQVLFFDGGLLSHGTVANDTACSRVSFDLRFAPSSVKSSVMTGRILGGRPAGSVISGLCPSLVL